MLDYNMILIDGSIDVDSDTAATFVAATSTTRSSTSGAVVIDLGVGGTPASGLSVVLIIPALTTSTDYRTAQVQASDAVAFGSDVHLMCAFDVAAATTGRILASECTTGLVVIRRFATMERYVRASITPTKGTGDGSFSTLKMYLTPFAFNVL
jgi:hypothetical protein